MMTCNDTPDELQGAVDNITLPLSPTEFKCIDTDGEIVILETPGGHETYWDQRAILDVAEELPFQSTDAEKDDTSGESEEEPVLGLDSQDDSAETK